MSDVLKDYFDALDRLKRGAPINVPKGTKITNDAVSQECGRKKGTIKKSRPLFSELIDAIKAAANAEVISSNGIRDQRDQAKAEVDRYRVLWEEALAREVSLLKELRDAREEWGKERNAVLRSRVAPIKTSS